MSTTYQSNILSTEYNGWENYETWNVALWIQNDEGLYNIAKECGSYQEFVAIISEFMTQTPDGVRFDDPAINVIQIDSDVFDFWPSVSVTHSLLTNTQMRYIPQSQYTFEEICKQCYDAINPPTQQQQPKLKVSYAEVRKYYRYDNPLLVAQ